MYLFVPGVSVGSGVCVLDVWRRRSVLVDLSLLALEQQATGAAVAMPARLITRQVIVIKVQ